MEKRVEEWTKNLLKLNMASMLHQKTLRLYEDFSKGLPKMSDTKSFIASKGWLHSQE